MRLELVLGGRTVQLTHTAGDWVILGAGERVTPGPAQVVLHVDDVPRRWDVEILPHAADVIQVPIRMLALQPGQPSATPGG